MEINYYLHQEIFHWKIALLFIHWNRNTSVIIILDVSFQVVWCLMTSLLLYSGTRNWNATRKNMIFFFTNIENKTNYVYRGSLQGFYCKKVTYECLYVPCVYFHIKIIKIKHYLTNILKINTSSDNVNEKIDHWLDSFEKLLKKCIIMPSE